MAILFGGSIVALYKNVFDVGRGVIGPGERVETEMQAAARKAFDDFVCDVRTDLHRCCSRMVGSSIEGEDVVQDVLAKAFYQLSELGGGSVEPP